MLKLYLWTFPIAFSFKNCLTYDDHLADHEVFVGEGGHGTLVLPRQFGGGGEDVEGAVHGALVT